MTIPQEVEAQLREALAEHAAALRSQIHTSQQLRVLTARFPTERRRWRTRLSVGAVAAVAAVVAAIVALVQLMPVANDHSKNLPAGPIILPQPAPIIGEAPMPAAQLAETNERFTAPAPDLVIGSVLWVDDTHEATITRIDLSNLHVLSTRHYKYRDSAHAGAMTAANGIVLLPINPTIVGGPAQILRFDATTGRQLSPMILQRAGAIVRTPAGVVAEVGTGSVGILDVRAGKVTRTFGMPVYRRLAYADGLIWGWDIATSTLVGVDPLSGDRARSARLQGFSDQVMQPDGNALLLDDGAGIARFDTRTGNVTAATPLSPLNLSRDSAGRLWGVVRGAMLDAFDPTSLRVVKSYRVRGLDLVNVSGNVLLATDRATGRVRAFSLDRLISGR